MVFCLHVRQCTTHVHDASGSQKRVSELIELELWMIVSCYVGDRKRAQVLCQEHLCSLPLSHLSSPKMLILNSFSPSLQSPFFSKGCE